MVLLKKSVKNLDEVLELLEKSKFKINKLKIQYKQKRFKYSLHLLMAKRRSLYQKNNLKYSILKLQLLVKSWNRS